MAYLLDTNVVSELRKGNRCETAVREWFDVLDEDDAYLSVLGGVPSFRAKESRMRDG